MLVVLEVLVDVESELAEPELAELVPPNVVLAAQLCPYQNDL